MILRHTPKSEQRFMLFTPFWEQAKAMIMPEIFNDEYLQLDKQFEAVDFWQNFGPDEATRAGANIYTTVPAWLEDMIANTTGSSDTKFTFNPKYILGCLYDKDAVLTDFQFEAARTTPLEARKNYINTWVDFGLGSIGDPSENFVLFIMSDGTTATETATGDGTTKAFTLTGNVASIKSVTVGSTATSAYTYAPASKTITFTTAPADDATITIVYYVKD